MHKPESLLENETYKHSMRFWDTIISTSNTDLGLIYKKKEPVIKQILPFEQTTEWK